MNKCFVIQPFDQDKFDKRYKDVFKPALKSAGLESYRVDEDPSSRIPINSIEKGIRDSVICLAEITLDNPNVWFELGYAISAGKKVILVCSNERKTKFPFDIQHRSVIKYNTDSRSDYDVLSKKIVQKAQSFLADNSDGGGISELVDYNTSRKGHYELAVKLMKKNCCKIFLMQRSSSLILGAEQGWGGEDRFHNELMRNINAGVEFVHIVSVEGILNHLKKKESYFPKIESTLQALKVVRGRVAIEGGGTDSYIKKVPETGSDALFKTDRQARTLITECKDGEVEGLLVSDLGVKQGWFSLKGPKVKKFLQACYDFYYDCENLMESDLKKIRRIAGNV